MKTSHNTCGCGNPITYPDSRCSMCGKAVKPPNITMALERRPDLRARYEEHVKRLDNPNRIQELQLFSLKQGKLVVNMRYTKIREMLENKGVEYGNFWQDFLTDRILGRNPDAVKKRMQVDAELFGHQCRDIRCGLFSMDGRGARFYGDYSVQLDLTLFEWRTSLLQDNPFNVKLSDIRKLCRSNWKERDILTVIRFGADAVARPTEALDIVLQVNGDSKHNQRFIEAHIWGGFTSESFAAVVAYDPGSNKRSALLKADNHRIEELCQLRKVPFTILPT